MAEEAAQFARRKERLGLEIDGLLRDLLQAWMGQAVQVKSQIDVANRAVDQAIKDIERDIDTAGNIVRAVGYIDNVVKIAADLVA